MNKLVTNAAVFALFLLSILGAGVAALMIDWRAAALGGVAGAGAMFFFYVLRDFGTTIDNKKEAINETLDKEDIEMLNEAFGKNENHPPSLLKTKDTARAKKLEKNGFLMHIDVYPDKFYEEGYELTDKDLDFVGGYWLTSKGFIFAMEEKRKKIQEWADKRQSENFV